MSKNILSQNKMATSETHVVYRGGDGEWWSILFCFVMVTCVVLASLVPLAFYKIYHLEKTMISKEELYAALEQYEMTNDAGVIDPILATLVAEPRYRRAAEGSQNCACPPGPKGDPGPRGERGRRGPDGRKGRDGTKGEKGDAGTGVLQGPRGPKGDIGPSGKDGFNGTMGTQGLIGDIGEGGPPGPPGTHGRDGLKGEQGPRGQRGPRGLPGISPSPMETYEPFIVANTPSNVTCCKTRIKHIHVQGVPDDETTGLSSLDIYGNFKSWKIALSSRAFQLQDDGNITVADDGLYFIYFNVLFYESSRNYGASTNINDTPFLRCIGSRATSFSLFGQCSGAGVAELNAGDRVSLVGTFPMRVVDMRPETSYFGIIKLSE